MNVSIESEQDGAVEKKSMIRKGNAKLTSKVAEGTKEIKIGSLMMTTTCKENWKSCRYCGEIHRWGSRNCSAYGKICKGCGKQNHFEKVCRSSGKGIKGIFDKIHDLDMRISKIECQSNADQMESDLIYK